MILLLVWGDIDGSYVLGRRASWSNYIYYSYAWSRTGTRAQSASYWPRGQRRHS